MPKRADCCAVVPTTLRHEGLEPLLSVYRPIIIIITRESSLCPGFTLCQQGEVRLVHVSWVSRAMPSSGARPRSDAVRRG